MDEKNQKKQALDDFWSIDNLMPKKKTPAYTPAPRSQSRPTPRAVEIEFGSQRVNVFDGENNAAEIGKIHYVPPHSAGEKTPVPKFEYTVGGLLIHKVAVFAWENTYRYFESFIDDALKYHAAKPPESVEYQPFFSYLPQYAQMRRAQLAYYLFWRERARAGEYIKTDYSYILLYIFELINLPHTSESAASARDSIALLWRNYRKAFPQLDSHAAEWMCDFCLVHRLPPSELLTTEELCLLSSSALLREFYLDPVSECAGGEGSARFFLRFCCSYDYTKSKFYQAEHRELFEKYIPSTLGAILPSVIGGKNGERPLVTLSDSTMTRDIYTGALCAYTNKLRVTVSYTSFSRSHELRFLIGDMVRHIENRLRAWIGTRSRLSVMSLPVNIRDAIDAYMEPRIPSDYISALKKAEQIKKMPDYERRYDLPRAELSLAGADEIEKSSWQTTKILTEAFDGEVIEEEITPTPSAPIQQALDGVFGQLAQFVRLCLEGNVSGQRDFAMRTGKMTDAIADEINAITADGEIGDIILEECDGGYKVIEDYEEQVRELI